jgi:hypothetical protein
MGGITRDVAGSPAVKSGYGEDSGAYHLRPPFKLDRLRDTAAKAAKIDAGLISQHRAYIKTLLRA